MNVILLGPPGAGKGTQARLLQDYYGLYALSTGQMLREEIRRETPIGLEVKATIEAGLFPSDEIVLRIFEDKLKEVKNNGVLLDGIPRNLSQADKVEEIFKRLDLTLDSVIQLEVDNSELIERIMNRRVCKACGTPCAGDVCTCSACGAVEFVKRSDDTLEAIKTRLEVYNEQTKPLVEYYKAKGLLKIIPGMQSVEDVFTQIKKALPLN